MNKHEITKGNYRNHTYEVGFTYLVDSSIGLHELIRVESYVDQRRLTLSTPGYDPSVASQSEQGHVQSVRNYIDYLEEMKTA